MGIAGFFLWLQRWYEQCIHLIPDSVVEKAKTGEVDRKAKSEMDNLYVDMNGLIHPCCHDTAPLPEPENEEEMIERILTQLDILVKVARPRKCLILCIDGVAPRSKLNQQRSRRFRAADERMEGDALAKTVSRTIVKEHKLPRPQSRKKWDHNVITPSTPFMERVAIALEWFIVKQVNDDPLWKKLVVVFSDAHVPGEGEHKIMQYIRSLRSQPGYDHTTSHAICGMDADLVCLGLSTHEEHVSILRNQLTETFQGDPDRFCYFDLGQYREALREDFSCIKNGDFERIIDDFVFLCFFVGNDFLPHVPLISIKTKGIESLLDHYVREFDAHGYLTEHGEVHYDRLRIFLKAFVKTRMGDLQKEYYGVVRGKERAKVNVEERCKSMEVEIENLLANTTMDRQEKSDSLFRQMLSLRKERKNLVADKEPLGFSYLSDFRVQYYESKFGWSRDSPEFEANIAKCCGEYLRGVQWVMRYYTRGCPSWEWYYPYYYSPLLEDLAAFKETVNVQMNISAPLHPVEQLLAVLPRSSVHGLPEVLQPAVLDPNSVLGKFYPDKVDVDFSEANFAYQGVLRIPFIDSTELRLARESLADLEEDCGFSLVFLNEAHPAARHLQKIVTPLKNKTGFLPVTEEVVKAVPIGGSFGVYESGWVPHGKLSCPDKPLRKYLVSKSIAPPHVRGFVSAVKDNQTLSFTFELDTRVEYNPVLVRERTKKAQKRAQRKKRAREETEPAEPATSATEGRTESPRKKTNTKRKKTK
ncbi:5'-3' exoribonuclease 2 [Angomonas deanei]|nr:5'-3' exoribonuclease 2 [Angomonas deanei]|eukprot:EPY36244.1 5'-3' exoribonuclease 2 [Angomonas deanei]